MGLKRQRRVMELRADDIRPNPMQPRQVFSEEALRELAESIAAHGILQPLTVRRANGAWELVAGERRLRAAKLAGLKTVPCLETSADDRRSAELALIENLQREDLGCFEEAEAIAAYLRRTGCTQESADAMLGRSPSAVANKLRLLRLSPVCRERLTQAGLSERHARALLRLEDETERLSALQIAGLTNEQIDARINKLEQDLMKRWENQKQLVRDLEAMGPAPSRMDALVDAVKDNFDYVIIDSPAGIGSGFVTAAAPADRALVVANAEPTSVRGAVKVRNKLDALGVTQSRLVINRFDKKLFKKLGFYPDLDAVIDAAQTQLIAVVPFDLNISVVMQRGAAGIDFGYHFSAFDRLSSRLQGSLVPLELKGMI